MHATTVQILKARLRTAALASVIALPSTKIWAFCGLATAAYPLTAKEMARIEIHALFHARHDFDVTLVDEEVCLLLDMALQAKLLVASFTPSSDQPS
jgi:predicted Abi (CAAX) family protease